MPRNAARTRQRILDAAYGLFYRQGFARTGLDEIAAAAGFTKRTLYQHFGSKDALIGAALALHHEMALARIRAWLDTEAASAGALLDSLFAGLARWAAAPRWQGSGFTRAAMELAGLPGHPARAMARRHKQAVEAALAERLAAFDAAGHARAVMLLLEGAQTLMLIHGDPVYAGAALAAAKRLVASRTP